MQHSFFSECVEYYFLEQNKFVEPSFDKKIELDNVESYITTKAANDKTNHNQKMEKLKKSKKKGMTNFFGKLL